MNLWMTRPDWRTCKWAESEAIHVYLFEQWIRDFQAEEQKKEEEQKDADREEHLEEHRERQRYERARDAADRAYK